MKNTKTLVERIKILIKIFWYKYILRHKYFVSIDWGSPDGDYSVIIREDKKGNRIIEKISYEK